MILGLGGAACIVGTLMPWLGTEGSERSSYQLASITDRLGLSDGSAAALLITCWPAVPVAIAVCAVLALARFDRAARLVAAASGALVVAGCSIAWSTPLPSRGGVTLAFLGSVVLVVGGAIPRRALR